MIEGPNGKHVTCKGCMFFDAQRMEQTFGGATLGSFEGAGYCRAHTPDIGARGVGHWPIVIAASDWCGEYRDPAYVPPEDR